MRLARISIERLNSTRVGTEPDLNGCFAQKICFSPAFVWFAQETSPNLESRLSQLNGDQGRRDVVGYRPQIKSVCLSEAQCRCKVGVPLLNLAAWRGVGLPSADFLRIGFICRVTPADCPTVQRQTKIPYFFIYVYQTVISPLQR